MEWEGEGWQCSSLFWNIFRLHWVENSQVSSFSLTGPNLRILSCKRTQGAVSRSRMRVRSRNSLKVLASNFQNRRRGRIRNFIGKYLCHPWVVYSFDSGYKSIDCCRVFTCRFWFVFDVLWVNFRGCCDVVWCLLTAVSHLQVVERGFTFQFLRE